MFPNNSKSHYQTYVNFDRRSNCQLIKPSLLIQEYTIMFPSVKKLTHIIHTILN